MSQHFYRDPLYVDGDFGPFTAEAWQIYMKNYSAWTTRHGNVTYNRFYPGVIDGDFGPMSREGLQRYLAYWGYYSGAIDGWIGPMSQEAYVDLCTDRTSHTTVSGYDAPWTNYYATYIAQVMLNQRHDPHWYRYPAIVT